MYLLALDSETTAMTFNDLHHQQLPLLLCNVWDVASANIAKKLGFTAIGTSSAAIAAARGLDDGEQLSFNDLVQVVAQIKQHCSLPLSVDIEAGYSQNPQTIVDNIQSLNKLGVVGINIEDSVVKQQRELLPTNDFAATLSFIKNQLIQREIEIFINARSDVFLVGCKDAVRLAKQRMQLYIDAGADGIFLPGIEQLEHIEELSKHCSVPLNVMCMPHLANFAQLHAAGVKRISMGNFVFNNMQQHLESQLASIKQSQSFATLF
ncbi:probable carboxyvinyl-carboxyphosphonate phosphorylmutase [Agarivorans albus MKT 106]|uniref:Probable carboxyvinyl-carboxyphosphonate phosphorylmutase n=2 Tax=Agarivorans albus TaxID=182262 RepID=R9PFA6_AGAAL|nr:probable carboxyvinyl-carboxyphosphonate phosphorylmutase [Agarivorans albus MKT 106]